jgi:hypothetical protein
MDETSDGLKEKDVLEEMGGDGAGWSDMIQLHDAQGGNNLGTLGTDWTIAIDSGSIQSQDADSLALSDNADGRTTLEDRAWISFNDIERVEW